MYGEISILSTLDNLSDEIMFYEPRLCASPSRATFDEETCKLLDSVYKEYLG